MNPDLEEQLNINNIEHERLEKKEKVKLLSRWIKEFPELVASVRRQENQQNVYFDSAAEEMYRKISECDFYILPDDNSGMPSYECVSAKPPDLTKLVSDTITKCDELVIVEKEFLWSAVLVNHGSPQSVSQYFCQRL